MVLSQDEPKAWVCLRTNSHRQVPERVSGIDAVIHVADLKLELPMAEIYESDTGAE